MSNIRITTPFNIDVEFTAPAFHRRLLAWFLDVLVQIFYVIIAFRLYNFLEHRFPVNNGGTYKMWAIGLALAIPVLTYHLFMEITMNGQSIGKRIMSMKVISENCGRPSVSQFLIRWLMRTSDYTIAVLVIMAPYASQYGGVIYWGMTGTIALLVLDVVLINSGKQQRLGDILAHTVMVNTTSAENISSTIFLETVSSYQPKFPQVLKLSDRDLNSIKCILDAAKDRYDYELATLAAQKVTRHLQIETDLAPIELLETILKDYNHLTANH